MFAMSIPFCLHSTFYFNVFKPVYLIGPLVVLLIMAGSPKRCQLDRMDEGVSMGSELVQSDLLIGNDPESVARR